MGNYAYGFRIPPAIGTGSCIVSIRRDSGSGSENDSEVLPKYAGAYQKSDGEEELLIDTEHFFYYDDYQ